MQNYSRSTIIAPKFKWGQYAPHLGIWTYYSSSYPDVAGEGFNFSGFGRNRPKEKDVPTPGEYVKWRYVGMRALSDMIQTSGVNPGVYNDIKILQGSWLNFQTADSIVGLGPIHRADVYNDALSRIYEKLKDSELNLAVSLGEYKETAKMIASAFNSMGQVIKIARQVRRDITQPSKLRKLLRKGETLHDLMHNPSLAISRAWLGYKYGWLPLYNDVYNALHHTTQTYRTISVKARRRKHDTTYGTRKSLNLWGPFYVNEYSQVERDSQCEIRFNCTVSNQAAFELTRITSLNPLTIAWELTPFSFVVDWFFDVGGYLQAQENALGLGLIFGDGYVTKTAWYTAKCDWYSYNGSGRGQSTKYGALKSRVRLTSFPRPVFPSLKLDLGSQRIMSAASLLRTVLLGGLKA